MEINSNNISQELLETIERYSNGTMTSKELVAFEARVKTDENFKTQVEDILTLLRGIEAQSLKEQFDVFHEDINKPKVSKDKAHKIFYLQFKKIAAAAIVIMAVGSLWFFSQNTNDRLYSKYFRPDPGLPTTMSNSVNFEFYDAMVNYKQGDYRTAIEKWEALKSKTPHNDTLNYFLGVAYLANKNEDSAISFLEKSIQNEDFPLVNDAYHYLGLAQLKEGNQDLAKSYLRRSLLEKSKALLSELE